MSNPFYTYSGAFLPGILARAEAETTEFQAVQSGFALLAIQGTDSGAANAYVVTTQGGKNNLYTDGMIIEFKAANANTGNSTVAVDGGSTVGLTDFQGQSLAGGAIKGNSWIRCLYNSTYSAWTLIAPTSQVITSNTISAAAPTHLVGLTAAGGVSLACAPIDVTFALDQSIAPTWTGAHAFSAAVTFNSSVNFNTGVAFTGGANQYAATFTGSSSNAQSYGAKVNAGTTAGDVAFAVNNQSGATSFFNVGGAGSILVGNPTGGGQGVGTINAQNLYVNGVAVLTSSATGANPTASVGLTAVNGSANTFLRSDGAPALSQAIAPTWTGAHTFTPGAGIEPIRVNAAANARAIVLIGNTNTVNRYVMEIDSGQGAGFSSGLLIEAGTNSSDNALLINNAANTKNYFVITGAGEVAISESGQANASQQTGGLWDVGYIDIPLHSTNAPAAGTDRGKFINASSNVTLPTGATIGTTMLIYNSTSGSITISSSDTITWIPNNTNGTRTLAAHSVATVYHIGSSTWLMWGIGIS